MAQHANARAADPGAAASALGQEIVAKNSAAAVNRQGGALRRVLEAACTEARCSANALTVLAVQNDPFRVDTAARHRDGQWLAINRFVLVLGRAVAPAHRLEGIRRGQAMNKRQVGEYIAEFLPRTAAPSAPCGWCGDTVFYQLGNQDGPTPWRCRTCWPLGSSGWRTVWCRHDPQCDPPEHLRTAVCRWFAVPPEFKP